MSKPYSIGTSVISKSLDKTRGKARLPYGTVVVKNTPTRTVMHLRVKDGWARMGKGGKATFVSRLPKKHFGWVVGYYPKLTKTEAAALIQAIPAWNDTTDRAMFGINGAVGDFAPFVKLQHNFRGEHSVSLSDRAKKDVKK